MKMRVGIGYDIHPLVKGEKLILGGIKIPCKYGLDGHSDADVLTHALMDAILGAMGKGDIGKLFPDSDDQYSGINSMILLSEVLSIMNKENYMINNIDLIVIAQIPRIEPHRNKILSNLASNLKISVSKINIKATTTEKLGFIGREEGIAAQAIISLIKEEKGVC